eukprot:CAMPEP_0197836966 /NCGR_PEP_ID=MMETSP1437-20131217/30632_1 /TAXON_ID=49252 ORGANISM="Eucampia antarctica, Strain CCMP1452" /NCGR_SAMPLE_ID=MMETSP1437 /ASSEMBLY_ACC=CAM_ASM_001096 /LENGTH=187 /DNA_ID=CAMNT_0043443585 /DNA_START=105 /DNA_END=668 /DNA_ORIENTATION=-
MSGGDTILPSARSKFRLKKGFALHDWVILLRSAKDLSRRKGKPIRRSISAEEISTHCTEYDAWISLHGKVYNITPYLHYHPGGLNIFRPCLGKDATALFEKYHRWVNTEGLIGPLLLGYLEIPQKRKDGNHVAKAMIPSTLLSQNRSKNPQPKLTLDMPPPSKNTFSPSLLPPSTNGNDEDDKNPWE